MDIPAAFPPKVSPAAGLAPDSPIMQQGGVMMEMDRWDLKLMEERTQTPAQKPTTDTTSNNGSFRPVQRAEDAVPPPPAAALPTPHEDSIEDMLNVIRCNPSVRKQVFDDIRHIIVNRSSAVDGAAKDQKHEPRRASPASPVPSSDATVARLCAALQLLLGPQEPSSPAPPADGRATIDAELMWAQPMKAVHPDSAPRPNAPVQDLPSAPFRLGHQLHGHSSNPSRHHRDPHAAGTGGPAPHKPRAQRYPKGLMSGEFPRASRWSDTNSTNSRRLKPSSSSAFSQCSTGSYTGSYTSHGTQSRTTANSAGNYLASSRSPAALRK